jgi:hypothetical protein
LISSLRGVDAGPERAGVFVPGGAVVGDGAAVIAAV